MLRIVVERAGDLLSDRVFRKELISIGRDPAGDVVLDDVTVSSLHLVIKAEPQRNGFRFFDQGWNGTVLNGQKVQSGHFDAPLILRVSDFDLTLIPLARTDTRETQLARAIRPEDSSGPISVGPTLNEEPARERPSAELRSLCGDLEPPVVTLTHRVMIGRSSDCDVRSARANVSRRHCEIFVSDRGFVIRRLSSRNGVEVNGRRLVNLEEHILAGGDIISFSGQQLIFLIPREDDTSELTAVVEASPNTDLAVYERPCRQEGIIALDVVGFLGAKTLVKFDAAVRIRISSGTPLLLDLGYLVGIDGPGIERLASLVEEAAACKCPIQFIRVPPRVGDVLALSPLMEVLSRHISRSEMSGVRQFNSSEGLP